MKKIVCLMALVLMVSCAPFKINFNHRGVTTDVYLDSDWSWVNKNDKTKLKNITLRLINKKYSKVTVKVRCEFPDETLFGEVVVNVKPRNDLMFNVRGFSRSVLEENEQVNCVIKSVKH